MDKLYDNLENYEEENIVDELRRENSQLKLKLEEYSVSIEKLQKDFDKISSEFKKLEMNYSSLLKTAKEEIERKTQIITKLNIEKDMMVLNAIQNKNTPVLRRTRYNNMSSSKDRKSDVDTAKVSNTESVNVSETTTNERKKQNHLSSEETTTSANTDIAINSSNKSEDRFRSKYFDAKENVNNRGDNVSKPKPMSISSRRKSMPATRSEIKFSSDEEDDSYCTAGTKYHHSMKPQSMLKSLHEKNRLLDDRYRTSTSSIDDKHSNYQDSRKDYRNHNSRYDSYKSRNRDKFESQKRKRHFSPERSRRITRNHSGERNTRQEYNRYRVLESPPPDRFHDYQRRNREGRSRDRHQDYYIAKYKLQNDNEEPLNKRRRHDSTHNRDEEMGWDIDRGPVQTTGSVEDINLLDCQSPDYSALQDAVHSQPVREIMNTAATPLEDPRLSSKRYILHQGDNVMLSTVTGRNVNLKVIHTSDWGVERVETPKALTRRPSQCSEDLAHNIYADIDNPVSNMSLESGEIDTIATDDLDMIETEQSFQHRVHSHVPRSIRTSQSSSEPFEKLPPKELDILKYKIPKLRMETENSYPSTLTMASNNTKELDVKDSSNKDHDSDKVSKMQFSYQIVKSSDKHESNNNNGLTQTVDTDTINNDKLNQDKFKTRKRHTVEGDLELSDENSDNIEVQKRNILESNITPIQEVSESNQPKSSKVEIDKNSKVVNLETNSEPIVNENAKTLRPKRKTQKSSNKDLARKEAKEAIAEKKTRSKKDKKEPKEIKAKFSELFGDTTSSLITPEDLGIPTAEAPIQSSAKYIPICEDAQDAVLSKPVETENIAETTNKETVVSNIVIESATKTECESKCKPSKVENDTKKKKPKNNENDKIVSSNNNEIDSKHTQNLPVEDHAKSSNTLQEDQADVEKMPVTNDIQNVCTQKSNLLLKALATSTPHKENVANPVVTVNTLSPNTNCAGSFKHDIVVSVDDSTATDQFSNSETLDSQTEVDAPDVRIFVKRRRKVLRRSRPS